MNFLRNITTAFKHALAAPGRFITTCDTLAGAVRENTQTLEALRRDLGSLSADGVLHHQELLKHVRYMAVSEHKRNQREGKHFELVS